MSTFCVTIRFHPSFVSGRAAPGIFEESLYFPHLRSVILPQHRQFTSLTHGIFLLQEGFRSNLDEIVDGILERNRGKALCFP